MTDPKDVATALAEGMDLLEQIDRVVGVYGRMINPDTHSSELLPELLAEVRNLGEIRKRWGR